MNSLNDYYQIPIDISAIYLDNTYAQISFTTPSTRVNPNYYYRVVLYDISGNYYDASGTTSPITVNNLTFNTTYSCYVELIQYSTSKISNITTLPWPKIYTFYLSDISYSSLNIRWTGLDISYIIVSRSENTNYIDISLTYLSFYPDSDLSGNTTYYYYITPYQNYNNVLNTGKSTSIISTKTLPAPPTNLVISYYDNSSVIITFTPARNSYTSSYYYILRTTYATQNIDVSGLTSPLQLLDLSGNTSYTMRVISAIDNSLNLYATSISSVTQLTLTRPPINLSVIYYDNSAIQLSFSAGKNTYNTIYYTLYSTDHLSHYNDISGTSTQLILTNLSGNTIYNLGVKNTLNGNISLVSSSVYGTQLTLTQPPTSIYQTNVDSSSITVGFTSGRNTYNSILYTASASLYSAIDGDSNDIKIKTSNTTTLNIGDLSGNTKYTISVGVELNGNSAISAKSLTTISSQTYVQAPENVVTTASDGSSVTISFTTPKNSYATSVYYTASVVDNSNNNIKNVDTDTSGISNVLQVSGLTQNTDYKYYVKTVLTARSSVGTVATYNPYPVLTTFSLTDMSYNFVNLNWAGTDISYVRVSRKIDVSGVYSDISNDYITPYQDIDISGNTEYYYYITPIRNYKGTLKIGTSSSVINTRTLVAPATDLSAIFYDTSAIKITFTKPKNTYTSFVYYTLRVINSTTGLYKEVSGNTLPLMITDLSDNTPYNCNILTYLDNNFGSISDVLTVTTKSIIQLLTNVDIVLPPSIFLSPIDMNITSFAITSNKMLVCSGSYLVYYLTYNGTSWGTLNANSMASFTPSTPQFVTLSADGTRGLVGVSQVVVRDIWTNSYISYIDWTNTIPISTKITFTNTNIIDNIGITQSGMSGDGTKFIIATTKNIAWGTWNKDSSSPNTTLNILFTQNTTRNIIYCNMSKDGNVIAYLGSYNNPLNIGLWNGTNYTITSISTSLINTPIRNIEVSSKKIIFINIRDGQRLITVYYNTSTSSWNTKLIVSPYFYVSIGSSCLSTDETILYTHSVGYRNTVEQFNILTYP